MPVITSDADVHGISFSKDGATLVGACSDSKVRLWDARSGALRKTLSVNSNERVVAMPSGTDLLAVSLADGTVEMRDLGTGKSTTRFAAKGSPSRRVAIGPNSGTPLLARSNRVEGNSRDEVMRLFETSGKERFAVPAGIGGASAIAVSPDAKYLAAGSFDTDVRIWDAKNGELLRRIDEILVATFAMDFTPDGKFLVTGGVDRTLYFWDTRTWKLARKLNGQPEMISALAIAPGGRMIATGGAGELMALPAKVLLWDTAANASTRSFDAPRAVESLAFSPDAKSLAAACGKKSVDVWTLASN